VTDRDRANPLGVDNLGSPHGGQRHAAEWPHARGVAGVPRESYPNRRLAGDSAAAVRS